MRGANHSISVIVPSKNEAPSIEPLVARLAGALNGSTAEVIFADDSTDDTPKVIKQVAETAPFPVVCLHRPPGQRTGGLGGAVLAGLRASTGDVAVVMDGDLQHPPETVPKMVRALDEQSVDVVLGSRYADGGNANGLSNQGRRSISRGATDVARALFPRRLAKVSDPMSGFFALRMAALDVDCLHPMGFKIFLEIILRNTKLRIGEVGFPFAPRFGGESKADLREGMRFLMHIFRLRLSTLARRPSGKMPVARMAVLNTPLATAPREPGVVNGTNGSCDRLADDVAV